MAEFEDLLRNVLEIKTIKEIEFKKIRIADKTLYFIYESLCMVKDSNIISYALNPVAFIMETCENFYYYSLNGEKMDKDIIKKFVSEFHV